MPPRSAQCTFRAYTLPIMQRTYSTRTYCYFWSTLLQTLQCSQYSVFSACFSIKWNRIMEAFLRSFNNTFGATNKLFPACLWRTCLWLCFSCGLKLRNRSISYSCNVTSFKRTVWALELLRLAGVAVNCSISHHLLDYKQQLPPVLTEGSALQSFKTSWGEFRYHNR